MEIYKSKEFCKKIKVSYKTLENLEKRGEIVPIRKGRTRYYTDDHINQYLNLKPNKAEDIKPKKKKKKN